MSASPTWRMGPMDVHYDPVARQITLTLRAPRPRDRSSTAAVLLDAQRAELAELPEIRAYRDALAARNSVPATAGQHVAAQPTPQARHENYAPRLEATQKVEEARTRAVEALRQQLGRGLSTRSVTLEMLAAEATARLQDLVAGLELSRAVESFFLQRRAGCDETLLAEILAALL